MTNPEEITIPEIVDEQPLDLYNGDSIKLLLKKVEDEVTSLVLDPANPADYKAFGSVQRKISSFKTTLDKKGDEIVRPIKATVKEVDASRKLVRDTCDRIRATFLAPREAFDAEIARKAKEVAEAFELFTAGWQKVGEFRKATAADWEALIERISEYVVNPNTFGERTDEAKEAQANGLEVAQLKKQSFLDDELALEAGRKALAEKASAEKMPVMDTKPNPAPVAPDNRKAEVHRAILADFVKRGLPDSIARELIKQIVLGHIPHVTINY